MVNTKIKRIIVAAVSKNGIIGNGNKIPWNSKEELLHFKKLTTGYPIMFGRRTFESIGKSLPNRLNIIISSNPNYKLKKNKLLSFTYPAAAYNYLRKNGYKKVFIGGGGKIYKSTIKYCEEMIISHMNFNVEGNIKFPKINMQIWEIVDKSLFDEFQVIHYRRK